MLYRGAVSVVVLAWGAFACSGVSSDPGDDVDGGHDVEDGDDTVDPRDTGCNWTAGCAGRTVRTVEGLAESLALSATPTPTGDIAVAYNAKSGAGGALVVITLDVDAGTWLENDRFTGGPFDVIGTNVALIASGEVMHMVYLSRMTEGDQLRYRILIPGAEPIPTQFGDFPATGKVALSFDAEGDMVAVGSDPLRFYTHVWRTESGNWDGPIELDRNAQAAALPGAVDIAADEQGTVALAYQHETGPRLRRWRTTEWTEALPLDPTAAADSASGVDVSLAFVASTPVIAYFDVSGAATSLRVARVAEALPQVTVLADDLVRPAREGRCLAIAADGRGTVYVAVLARRGDVGVLELWSQPADGKWQREVIDDAATTASDARFHLDLVLDGGGRPHVLYYSGARGELRWASGPAL